VSKTDMNDVVSRRAALARLAGLLVVGVLPPGRRGSPDGFPHPEPRAGVTAANVLLVEKLPNKKRVLEAYAAAREHPELFDGVYCICDCSDRHRSLLSCFESDQPTGCWGCQAQAEFITRLAKEGKNLAEIRTAIDKKWDESNHSRH
jgi:hypothetical protein